MQTYSNNAFTVNGSTIDIGDEDAQRPLLWYLRDRLGLLGSKFGCGHGNCGACTVELDGKAVPRLRRRPEEAAGKSVTTIEGSTQEADDAADACVARRAGSAMRLLPARDPMASSALLREHSHPTDAQIDAALRHALCRCGTYQRVRAAIHLAAEERLDRRAVSR